MSSGPEVAVVVATYNRATRLACLIAALDDQQGLEFEVILVDDASTDGTPAELERLCAATHHPARFIRLAHNSGPAVARNAGWRVASAPIIAFTDDDCLPQAGWLVALVAGFAHADIVQGATFPDPALARSIGPFGHTIDVTSENGVYETCNIAYRRSLLEKLGGFDEGFRHPYGEDMDLAWRAKKAGGRSTFAGDARVQHEVRQSNYRAFVRGLGRSEGLVLAMRRHPELRRPFPLRLFFSPTHPMALLTAAAAAAIVPRPRSPRRWALLATACAGYSRECMRTRHWPPRGRYWATAMPLALAADIVQVGILAAASARYRTLFL